MGSRLSLILVNTLAAVLVGLLFVWFFATSPNASKGAVDIAYAALAYFEKPAVELRNIVGATRSWVLERRTLQHRNQELEAENLRLRTSLHRSLAQTPVSKGDLIGASVNLRYPDAWWKELRVDKGARDGIRVGAPALSEGYLVGRVVRVGDDHAWVELITSASFMLAAVIDDTWDLGVINGDDMGGIWLMYIPEEREFDRGMMLSTALVGDYLPPGIPIGRIWGSGEARGGYKPQMVASGAHLTQLYTVQILRSGEDGEGAR